MKRARRRLDGNRLSTWVPQSQGICPIWHHRHQVPLESRTFSVLPQEISRAWSTHFGLRLLSSPNNDPPRNHALDVPLHAVTSQQRRILQTLNEKLPKAPVNRPTFPSPTLRPNLTLLPPHQLQIPLLSPRQYLLQLLVPRSDVHLEHSV